MLEGNLCGRKLKHASLGRISAECHIIVIFAGLSPVVVGFHLYTYTQHRAHTIDMDELGIRTQIHKISIHIIGK